MTFNDIAKGWVEAGCKLVDDNKDNPKMYAYGVKKALNTMLENFAEVQVVEWHPYPNYKPTIYRQYLVTTSYGTIFIDNWWNYPDGGGFWGSGTDPIAWAELPALYEEEKDEVYV